MSQVAQNRLGTAQTALAQAQSDLTAHAQQQQALQDAVTAAQKDVDEWTAFIAEEAAETASVQTYPAPEPLTPEAGGLELPAIDPNTGLPVEPAQ
jgi:hypothetical protein